MFKSSLAIRLALTLFASLLLSGCGPAPAPGPPIEVRTGPTSVAEGVARLGELRDTIKSAFDAGTPHECDDALHEAFDITTSMPGLAQNEGFTAEALASVKSGTEKLAAQLMKIHDGFHDHGDAKEAHVDESEGNVYESVADDINEALESLASIGDSEVE